MVLPLVLLAGETVVEFNGAVEFKIEIFLVVFDEFVEGGRVLVV